MGTRLSGLGAVAGALLAPAIVLAVAASPQRQPETRRPVAFLHSDHVSTGWLDDKDVERLRDCRGCHVYGDDSIRDPQETCRQCHFRGEFELSVPANIDESFKTSLGRLREDDSPVFDHFEHERLECKACHEPDAGPRRVLDPMPVRRGIAECARCHATGAATELRVASGKRDGPLEPNRFYAGIDANAAMRAEEFEAFSHADHLDDPSKCPTMKGLASAGRAPKDVNCLSCHDAAMEATAARFHGSLFDRDECGDCHVSTGNVAEVMGATERSAVSRSLFTFSHADHVKATLTANPKLANAAAYKNLGDRACLACHAHGEASGAAAPRGRTNDYHFSLSPSPDSFEGCVACHDAAEWKPNHGDWEARTCTVCHAFDGKSDMKTARPTVPVKRVRPVKFRIPGQAHPFITSSDGAPGGAAADCAECHRAAVTSLPSRIQEKPFNHATHLGPQPTEKDCATCHEPVVTSSGSADLVLSYDLESCRSCHKAGLEAVEGDGADASLATVVSFPHGSHLAAPKTGKPLSCAECHAPDPAGDGADYTTTDEAARCTKCHDHSKHSATTGNIQAIEVSSCQNCHRDGSNRAVCVVPAVDSVPFAVSRLAASAGRGSQIHPPNRACDACHVQLARPEVVSHVDHVSASIERGTIRGQNAQPVVHEESTRYGATPGMPNPETEPEKCLGCHWMKPATRMKLDPALPLTRRQFGDAIAEYPGWPDWPGHQGPPR